MTPDRAMLDEDDQLMLRLQEGDRTAFDGLVERHRYALLGFFFRNTRDIQLSEDLTQDTLLKVYNQAWDFLPRGAFRGWMFRIARNLLIDNTRRRSHDALVRAVRGRQGEEDDGLARIEGRGKSSEEEAEQRELAALVDATLPLLPDEQRQTFVMHHFDGLSLPEVAVAMETSLPTCKSRLRLAREKLRDKLKERGVYDPRLELDK